ncbi:MAG: histidinol-phosphate transaminase [Candidatus Brocadiia bacterium]
MSQTDYFRPNIRSMHGYVPGEQPEGRQYLKLNANENPYPPSPRVLEAVRQACSPDLRLYPDAMATPLRRKIAERHGLAPERVLVGNGSDDLLTMILRAFVGEGGAVVAPRPTYPLYDVLVAIQGGEMRWVDFPDDFSLPPGLAQPDARVTFLANPNSPSGTWIEPGRVAALAEEVAGVLVVDEAYVDFADSDCTPLLERFPQVIVLRSFSKSFSLAGVRIGYALASEDIIAGLVKVKDSYNVNRFAVAAGVAALEDIGWMERNAAAIRGERRRLSSALEEMGLFVYPSRANFVAARSSQPPAKALAAALQEAGILIRTFADPTLDDWMRITLGTPEHNDRVLDQLARALGSHRP